jgi:hypothetical protein
LAEDLEHLGRHRDRKHPGGDGQPGVVIEELHDLDVDPTGQAPVREV